MTDANLARISDALRDAARRGHDEARTMPAVFYTDPDFLALEDRHLFAKEWQCVGRVEEIREPGSYMMYRLGDEALVIVHGEDGRVRALSNVCRHRGTLIVRENGKGRRLLCPYHHWAYDLTGQLTAAPNIPPRADFDMASCRLPEFPCETWMGFVFVSLDHDARPLRPRLSAIEARVRPYHMEAMWLGYLGEDVWETNWKALVENYMEAYHLSPLHRATLAALNPTRLARHVPPGEAWFAYEVGFPADLPRVTRGHGDLTPEQADTCIMMMIGAATGIGLAADYSSFLCVQPEGPAKVRFKAGLLFWGEDWTQDAVDRAVELFHATMAEDRLVTEAMMTGYRSAYHATGPLAPAHLEGPILDLTHYVGRCLASVLPGPGRAAR
ncbi:MAG: aromatic ring-hydroxylating dioxygenase subunit alpha [Alphaproteobacteria bacterium]